MSQECLQHIMILKIQLQQINERLASVVQDALAMEERPDRSPSPPPKYDSSGKRSNTREVRMRETLFVERSKIIEEMLKLNPTFQAPADFVKAKPVKRIWIQKHANPLINFIGLIIGPRGNTQRQMEAETGAKISIRGKGSAKQGSLNRAKQPDDDEDLHVHITADEEEKVDKAVAMVERLLNPSEEDLNMHKQKQLRELALINGTLREDEYCPICGEKGHRQFECPHRSKAFKAAAVKCAICGDLSHPTRDCPLKEEKQPNAASLDNEYDSFMAELSGAPPPVKSTATSGTSATSASAATSSVGSTFDGSSSLGSNYGTRVGNSIVLAPSVDLFANKKKQTVIAVTKVMTGGGNVSSYSNSTSSSIAPQLVTTTAVTSTDYDYSNYQYQPSHQQSQKPPSLSPPALDTPFIQSWDPSTLSWTVPGGMSSNYGYDASGYSNMAASGMGGMYGMAPPPPADPSPPPFDENGQPQSYFYSNPS